MMKYTIKEDYDNYNIDLSTYIKNDIYARTIIQPSDFVVINDKQSKDVENIINYIEQKLNEIKETITVNIFLDKENSNTLSKLEVLEDVLKYVSNLKL